MSEPEKLCFEYPNEVPQIIHDSLGSGSKLHPSDYLLEINTETQGIGSSYQPTTDYQIQPSSFRYPLTSYQNRPMDDVLDIVEPLLAQNVYSQGGSILIGNLAPDSMSFRNIHVRDSAQFTPDLLAVAATHPAEKALMSRFKELVAGLSVSDIAVPIEGRSIANLERYRFTPVVGNEFAADSRQVSGIRVDVEPGIKTTYSPSGFNEKLKRPYVDTHQAIGLAYGNHLIAVAAAGVDETGMLTICQIQDVSWVRKPKKDDPIFVAPDMISGDKEIYLEILARRKQSYKEAMKRYYSTGFHNGMQWRDTLVQAWEILGEHLGTTGVAIQSNRNSRWLTVRESSERSYDVVADRMGYKPDPISRNWVKSSFPNAA